MERQIEELFKYGDHVILFAVNAQLEWIETTVNNADMITVNHING
jgi:hypothetical protein